jgi:hypothetical protein
MGAVKKPEMTFRAIHWPWVFAYGLQLNSISHIRFFLIKVQESSYPHIVVPCDKLAVFCHASALDNIPRYPPERVYTSNAYQIA